MELNLSLEVREYRPEDAAAALALRNAVFPPIGPEHWPQSQTAAVALLDGRMVGVIPFAIRDFEIAPGVAIRGAFANSVAVAEGYRDRGIGTRMMAEARSFLPRWVEAMFVYTGDEREGLPYRFYVKTGHHDLAYPRRLRWATPAGVRQPEGAEVLPVEATEALEANLLAVYGACYAQCAGTPPRRPGYWRQALASHIFVEIPHQDFMLVALRTQGVLQAYALAGLRRAQLVVLECAARQESAADDLWQAVGGLAGRRGAAATLLYGQDLTTPLYASALRAGFIPEPRRDVLVGHVLAPEALYERRREPAPAGSGITVEVWTPARSLTLRQAAQNAPTLSLEMKEETLHRLLLARVDLQAAVREQRVTVRAGGWDLVGQVAAILQPVPWVYHHLDYI